MDERKRRNLFFALSLTGLLGLAPLWYQLQGGMTHAKTTYPAVSEPIKLDLPLPARRATLPAPSVRSFPKSFQVTVPEMEAPDSEVVPAEAHAAIKSFQLDAVLFPSRLEPEAAHQLSSAADEPR